MHRSIRLWLLCLAVAAAPSCMAPPLEISPAILPNGVEGDPYRQELVVDADADDDVTWTIATGILPPGLDLSADTGVLSGIPASSGIFEFTVSASNDPPFPRSGRQRYAITVIERLTLDAGLQEARVDQPYDDGFDAVGGVPPYVYEVIGLPAGLVFDQMTGAVSGTPLIADEGVTLEVTVIDSGAPQQRVTQRTKLVIKPIEVSIITESLAPGRVSQAYSEQLAAANGRPPFTWAVVDSLLPSDLSLDTTTGAITGVPFLAGSTDVTIQVTDSDGVIASADFTIVVEP